MITPPKVGPTQAELSDISNLQHAGLGKQKKASRQVVEGCQVLCRPSDGTNFLLCMLKSY